MGRLNQAQGPPGCEARQSGGDLTTGHGDVWSPSGYICRLNLLCLWCWSKPVQVIGDLYPELLEWTAGPWYQPPLVWSTESFFTYCPVNWNMESEDNVLGHKTNADEPSLYYLSDNILRANRNQLGQNCRLSSLKLWQSEVDQYIFASS